MHRILFVSERFITYILRGIVDLFPEIVMFSLVGFIGMCALIKTLKFAGWL